MPKRYPLRRPRPHIRYLRNSRAEFAAKRVQGVVRGYQARRLANHLRVVKSYKPTFSSYKPMKTLVSASRVIQRAVRSKILARAKNSSLRTAYPRSTDVVVNPYTKYKYNYTCTNCKKPSNPYGKYSYKYKKAYSKKGLPFKNPPMANPYKKY
jgi:hypothetical protein